MASYDYTELALPGWYRDNRCTPYDIQALDYFTVNTNQSFSSPQPTSAYSSFNQYTLNLLSQPKSPPNATSEHPFQSGSATSTESPDNHSVHSLSVTADKVPSPGGHSNSSTGDDNDIDIIKNENSGSGFADVKLRSASRKPKRPRKKTAPSLQARECHNEVEKQYRTRLKLRFENLLAVLQASRTNDDDLRGASATEAGYVLSRGEVLDAATHLILALEKENDKLSSRVKQLTHGAAVG
ncbi:Allergen Fus c 3 [Fusarium oxysporum f. sp. rapae]|uniref:Allergen Fus c 3 n=1 Tax=Fusarium oxysporum f. sp. rapae TaxID=485398 RepID=A0A8J5NJE7_FUSOX|nr:Allergen Fus c 3 [Fusarium oxysporum f. sp. rapae]